MPNFSDLNSALGETRAWLQAKHTMAAGKINYGCFEMLSWPHRTSANIINTCFWLLETCMKCSYFIEQNIPPGAQRLAFELKYEYIVHQPRIYRGPAFCAFAAFQTSGDWSVNHLRTSVEHILSCLYKWGMCVWPKRTNCQQCCPILSNPSTSPWTAWFDSSGSWDNRMAAQHLSREELHLK